MFKKVDSKVNLVKVEEKILKFWDSRQIFKKTLEKTRNTDKKFVFYEGPPTANGEPGVHHVLSRVFKDVFPRFKTMNGFYVKRKAGWDTHGLPVELEVEKQLGINSKKEIEEIGIEHFNHLCRESVMKYEEHWKRMTERIGFWIDMDDAYFTFKNDYIETVWWILKTIWDKDLLYEDYKIVPYCPRCGTALSSHEVAQGYENVQDFSVIVKFPLQDEENTFLLVWTTTPWTLISNVACAVNPAATYVEISDSNDRYILAKDLLEDFFEKDRVYRIFNEFSGTKLLGMRYKPVYKYTAQKDAFRIVAGEFVSVDEGTGIVHIAPAFGEDDMQVGRAESLPVVQMVDEEGRFKPEVKGFTGMYIDDANQLIIEDLKKRKLLFKVEKFEHSYPFCWRCDKRLIYYAKKSWYIRTSRIKEDLLKANEEINWYPPHIKSGRFGKWLENNVDWALTRERYWGTPLPIWIDENGHKLCIGSIEDLRAKAKNMPGSLDLHKPYVDRVIIQCPECGKDMHRTPEVIDVWFDSGAMPFAQYHYPFENREVFDENYPADFICEAIDQTRGWFYTMLTISTLLFNKSSYKNVLCLGLINDEFGQKMSKSKGNVVKPMDVLNKQGADALRWYFFTAVSPWNAKNFSIKAIDEVIRKFILTLWNTYSFFIIYANIDNFNPDEYELEVNKRNELDRWIISELNKTIRDVGILMDNFNVTDSGRLIESFVNDLSNWYVRRSRRRFWKSENDSEKISAYKTLYECLLTLSKLLAPYVPFISEEIYQNLSGSTGMGEESVHLESYPAADEKLIDLDLSFKMDTARRVIGLGRSVRSKESLKIRQPLYGVRVFFERDEQAAGAIEHFSDIIMEELNVKDCKIVEELSELVSYNIKPNLKLLGPKYGAAVPLISRAIESENPSKIVLKVRNGKTINLVIEGRQIDLLPEEILVEIDSREGLGIESDGKFTVGLTLDISDELAEEGFCREFVHQIQNFRKEAGFQIENTIDIAFRSNREAILIIEKYRDYIMKETLAEKLDDRFVDGMFLKDLKINDEELQIGIIVAGSIV